MSTLLIYFLQSSAGLLLFFAVYKLFLGGETFFRLIRLYLVGTIVIALLAPLATIKYSVHTAAVSPQVSYFKLPWQQPKYFKEIANSSAVHILEEIVVAPETYMLGEVTVADNDKATAAINYIIWLYWLGVAYFGLRLVWQSVAATQMIRQSKLLYIKGIKVAVVERDITPFSFFNYVCINPKDMQAESEKILAHEREHVKQRHYIDLLLIEIVAVFLWFNPLVWLYEKAIKETHEYLADFGVIARGFDKSGYQAVIVSQLVGVQMQGIANNFSKSLIKKRITMMSRIKSSRMAALKALIMLPIAGILVMAFAQAEYIVPAEIDSHIATSNTQIWVSGEDTKTDKNLTPKDLNTETENALVQAMVTDKTSHSQSEIVYNVVEEMPVFPGGEVALRKYIAQNVAYPQAARDANIQGKVYVQFTVFANGSVGDTKIVRSANEWLDAEAMRVVASLPDFAPGKQRGEAVNVRYVVPINFDTNTTPVKQSTEPLIIVDGKKISGTMSDLNADNIASISVIKDSSGVATYGEAARNGVVIVTTKVPQRISIEEFEKEEETFYIVEQMPEFPGGELALRKYLATNLAYPKEARDANIQGKVYVKFAVMKDGSVANVQVARSVHESLDNEAIRVITSMPKWKAGTQRNKSVNVWFTVPINFQLANTAKKEARKPLCFVDGHRFDHDLSTLPVEAIEKIEVLKDSVAVKIYGKEAKDGVILISMKKTAKKKVLNNNAVQNDIFAMLKDTTANKSASENTTKQAIDAAANDIKIFPNPTDGIFTIKITSEPNNARVRIFDMNGSLVKEQIIESDNATVNLNTAPAGTYLVIVTNNGKEFAQKVVKQ